MTDRRRSIAGSGGEAAAGAMESVEAREDLERRIEEAFDLELLELATTRIRDRVARHTWEAFRLTAVDGLSGADAAARLGVPVLSVFKARSNVQKMLREEIERLDGPE